MARFQPKITRARFVVSGVKTPVMLAFGEAFNRHMQTRIKDGLTIYDTSAKPLSASYLKHPAGKHKYGNASNIRDLVRTGRMMRSMKVIQVNENRAVIYFTDAEMVQRMAYNQRRSPQWGISPRDNQFAVEYVHNLKLVSVQQSTGIARVA